MNTKLTVILALLAILSGTVQAAEKNGRFKGVIAGATFDVAVECYVGESVNHRDMIRFVTNSGMGGEKNEDEQGDDQNRSPLPFGGDKIQLFHCFSSSFQFIFGITCCIETLF